MSRHIYIAAAEASGDALAAEVIDALRRNDPAVRVSGIGGALMADRGVSSSIDMSGLAILGLFDGVKAYGRVKAKVEEVAAEIARLDPDAVVLVDSWGFMWRLARALKLQGLRAKRIKLVGPQVWATRPGRARVLAQWCDHLLCIHAFEQPFYKHWGLPTTVIGNPALNRLRKGDGGGFRASHGLQPETPVIGLLPGSRPSEIRRVAPVLIAACAELCSSDPSRKVVCVAAPPVEAELRRLSADWTFPFVISADEAQKPDAFSSMDVALACSGTVTTELAEQGPAMIVGYKLGWLTWMVARAGLWRSRYMSLLNVAADREVAPEFVQTRFTVANITAAAEHLLANPSALAEQKAGQAAALKSMAGPGRPAAEIAAETILRIS